MSEILTDSPGGTILAFGLTQYNLGAVVLTLKAKGWSEEFERNKYSVEGSVNVPILVSNERGNGAQPRRENGLEQVEGT